jgi:hypothetical protein
MILNNSLFKPLSVTTGIRLIATLLHSHERLLEGRVQLPLGCDFTRKQSQHLLHVHDRWLELVHVFLAHGTVLAENLIHQVVRQVSASVECLQLHFQLSIEFLFDLVSLDGLERVILLRFPGEFGLDLWRHGLAEDANVVLAVLDHLEHQLGALRVVVKLGDLLSRFLHRLLTGHTLALLLFGHLTTGRAVALVTETSILVVEATSGCLLGGGGREEQGAILAHQAHKRTV